MTSLEQVAPVLDTSLFLLELKHRRRERALEDLALSASANGSAYGADRLRDALLRRERCYSSAIGKGVAIPHARSIAVSEPLVIVARSVPGVDWKSRDGLPVHLVLAVVAPADFSADAFFELVAHAAGAARLQRHRQRLLEAPDA